MRRGILREVADGKAVEIGRLQRYATAVPMEKPHPMPAPPRIAWR
ncbi:hypothetical protein ACFOHK_10835 [Falsigemmobacter intermedius]|nr:hypothetical protein [Falsigemmobacter intermedius]